MLLVNSRVVARSENPRGLVVLGGDNVPPLVKIGLTDPPKTGGAYAPPASPLETCLGSRHYVFTIKYEHSNKTNEKVMLGITLVSVFLRFCSL